MPSGHTNKKDINKRRPISPQMQGFLAYVKRSIVKWAALSTIEKNICRALLDRKMLTYDDNTGIISITPKGKKELPK